MPEERIAVVTGGNRGIGKEICRQLAEKGVRVILTARDQGRGEAARSELAKGNLHVLFHPLDVTDPASIEALRAFIEKEFGRLDILVNNAAVLLDQGMRGVSIPIGVLREMMEVNTFAPLMVSQALIPLLKKSRSGRIVNVSSGMGSLATMGGGNPAYRISKAALNAVTRILADELKGSGVHVNSVHPGWVRTDMGGRHASRSVEEGADTPVWLALQPEGGPTGGFFRDREAMPW